MLRRSAFFGDAIGHASLAGVALGVVSGLPPLPLAAAVAVGIGLSLHELDRRSQLGLDTLLGIALPLFMSIGILILSRVPGYQPELFSCESRGRCVVRRSVRNLPSGTQPHWRRGDAWSAGLTAARPRAGTAGRRLRAPGGPRRGAWRPARH